MDLPLRSMQRPGRMLVHRLYQSRSYHHCICPSLLNLSPATPRTASSSPTSLLRTPNTTATSYPPSNTLSPATPSRVYSTTPPQPQFAEGVDVEQARSDINALREQGWALDEDGAAIKKTFFFRSYFKAVSFVNVIASQSATKKHHPTMTVRIGSVDVQWTTHNPRGLTDKDVVMARHCEHAAELMGTVEQGQGKKCGPGA